MDQKIAIIGRPNVGKSSLFNALLGYRRSIVFDQPGTTLDSISEKADWEGQRVILVDTQGTFGEDDEKELSGFLSSVDIVLFVVEATTGLSPFDRWLAKQLRSIKKPILVCVNKSEGKAGESAYDFSAMGFKDVLPISVLHRQGLGSLKEWCLEQNVEPASAQYQRQHLFTLAIVGRPNVGKSTLMNQLCRTHVSTVSPIAHTTRDTVSYELQTEEGIVRLLDTGGIRRRRQKAGGIESLTIHAAELHMRKADVCLLVVDGSQHLMSQEIRLFNLVADAGKPVAIVLNFWDNVKKTDRRRVLADVQRILDTVFDVYKVIPISAKTGFNVHKCLPVVAEAHKRLETRTSTAKLNTWLKNTVDKNPPPSKGKANFNLLYATQVKNRPPTYVFFMNRKEALPQSYKRYLANSLKREFDLQGQPVRLLFRAQS